jgi:hypothetical protein
MPCKICGHQGHNSRTCPQLLPVATPVQAVKDDHALWVRYSGLTKAQARELRHDIEKSIEEIAPDSHGVIATARASRLPERIQQILQAQQEQIGKSDDE